MTVSFAHTEGSSTERIFNHGHLFCGLGGGAKGYNRSRARLGLILARSRCIGGVDVIPAAIKDFETLSGVRGTVLDLFTVEQYLAFHGHMPPPGWREAIPDDIRAAFGDEHPHLLFLSAPCKGFSGLLSEEKSRSDKYQALNALTLRGVWLALEAYKDDPVEFFAFENVPRIATRGRRLLDQIIALFQAYGYAVAETQHDCGRIGRLAQSRKRFLLVARCIAKIPNFLYEPAQHPLRTVGELLDRMPLPGDPAGGVMHRMPSLQWKTWVRLAFVEAGHDWRSLNRLNVEDGVLTDYLIEPGCNWQAGVLGVNLWGDHAGVVPGESRPTNGAHSVADPRVDGHVKSVQLGVGRWNQSAAVIKGCVSVGTGRYAVADARLQGPPRFNNVYRVLRRDQAAQAVTGGGSPTAGGLAVADARPPAGAHTSKYRVTRMEEAAGAVIGASTTGQGAFALADPRPGYGDSTHRNILRVTEYKGSSRTVTGAHHPTGGGQCVADPRPAWGPGAHPAKLAVQRYEEAARTATGARVQSGAICVADPRPGLDVDRPNYRTGGHYGVIGWPGTPGAVSQARQCHTGPWSVADPRGGIGDTLMLPGANDRLVAVIQAEDGTWHRPFTTLELAAIQGLIEPEEHLQLDGLSDSAWRERIGNAVPPPAAEAIGSVMLMSLLLAEAGETFALRNEPIWVRPVVAGIACGQGAM
jgi:site-specific DNA-cytosine methylase